MQKSFATCVHTTYYLVSPFPEFVLQRVISCIYQSQRILEIVLIIIMNPCYANYAREQNKQKVQQRKKVTQLLNADKGVQCLETQGFLSTQSQFQNIVQMGSFENQHFEETQQQFLF